MMRWLIGLVFVVVLWAIGSPYLALALEWPFGTHSVAMFEHDGTRRDMIMGPNAPRPDFATVMPGAVVVTATHWVPSPRQPPAGGLDVLSRDSLDDIAAWYRGSLEASGFAVEDIGIEPMSPALAEHLAHAKTLKGRHPARGTEITVSIGTPQGWITRARLVKLHWRDPPPAASTGG